MQSDGPENRYARQIRFGAFGEPGQGRFRRAKVAIVGCGALGTFSAAALARAGIGRLRIIDRDHVEWSNLQRQWLFDEGDARDNALKAPAAAAKIAAMNGEVAVEAVVADLDAANIEELLEGCDLVLDAVDNFETRYLLNDYCVREKIPWVYGAAVGSYGLAFPVLPDHGPCLRCIYPESPSGVQPTCDTAGVLNTITSQIASWQCALATRILTSPDAEVPLRLSTFDTWSMNVRQTVIHRDDRCPCCVERRFDFLDGRRRAPISLCGRDAVQIHERRGKLDLNGLEAQLRDLGEIRLNEFALRFSPGQAPHTYELTFFPDGRAIIKGTTDPAVARSLYARYAGR